MMRCWLMLLTVALLSCASKDNATEKRVVAEADTSAVALVEIEKSDSLVVYYPKFERVDFVCEKMPEKTDSSVIFVCEAAFTGQLLDEFSHFNIAGDHVSGGKYYKGYKCGPNTGTFVYSNGSWQFIKGTDKESLRKAADAGGMGFGQNMVVYNGEKQPIPKEFKEANVYRVLAEKDGKLCVVEGRMTMKYPRFVDLLVRSGVKYAMYLDMGTGWNYSWYRHGNGDVEEIFSKKIPFTTNWITFYR